MKPLYTLLMIWLAAAACKKQTADKPAEKERKPAVKTNAELLSSGKWLQYLEIKTYNVNNQPGTDTVNLYDCWLDDTSMFTRDNFFVIHGGGDSCPGQRGFLVDTVGNWSIIDDKWVLFSGSCYSGATELIELNDSLLVWQTQPMGRYLESRKTFYRNAAYRK